MTLHISSSTISFEYLNHLRSFAVILKSHILVCTVESHFKDGVDQASCIIMYVVGPSSKYIDNTVPIGPSFGGKISWPLSCLPLQSKLPRASLISQTYWQRGGPGPSNLGDVWKGQWGFRMGKSYFLIRWEIETPHCPC